MSSLEKTELISGSILSQVPPARPQPILDMWMEALTGTYHP